MILAETCGIRNKNDRYLTKNDFFERTNPKMKLLLWKCTNFWSKITVFGLIFDENSPERSFVLHALSSRNSTWRVTTMCDLIKITNFDKNSFSIIFIKITGFVEKKTDLYFGQWFQVQLMAIQFWTPYNLKIIITFLIPVRTELIRAGRT